ncbi:cytochrome p450 83b1 [Phtheirospermum japonicum]|uniref:Cytochrome p450 83b1 n=1 Tax=Phtheirospermum japonicum TaxID=374723 RepID=A0A830CV22_9LAMI|nr:cytochrome p450 83b1 [Phtheirospermum japonicum]
MSLLLLSLTFPLIILFIFHAHRKKLQNSKYPPGPPGIPFIGNLHQFDTSTPHIYLWQLSKKYGPLMSMKLGSVPLLVVSSPEIAKEVLKTNDLAFSSRPRILGQVKLSYNRLDIAFAPYSESWRELRKICVVHLLSNKQVHSFRPIREDEVFRMIRNISDRAVVDLSATMLSLTSTLICKVAFGKTLDKVCRDYDELYQEIIDEHLDPSCAKKVNPDNILDLLIQLKEDKSCSINLTWDHVKAILMNIFIAGTDTGAATVVWTMTALMKNPTAMNKLQKHIRELIGEKGKVNEDDLPNLPYLKAVIKESLRLYPPAPLLLPRETLEKCNINGYTIQPKTLVYVNAWAIARDPEYWENPNEFQPERFLNNNVDIVGQDFQVIPFGSGRRGCPGISMGLATVEIALANLVYAFDWEMPPGMSREDIDTEVSPGLTMHKKNPLCLVPKKYI